jgi:hypothetical protein
MTERTVVFQGHRWPAAEARTEPIWLATTLEDGTPLAPQAFVQITTTGQGADWTPEPVDASWRDMSQLDLADAAACQTFVRRRGDPAGRLAPARPIMSTRNGISGTPRMPSPSVPVTTSQWLPLVLALRQAAGAWGPADADGVSPFLKARRREAKLFVKHPAAAKALKDHVGADSDRDGDLVDHPRQLAGFLVLTAAAALVRGQPMKRCLVCSSWFSIRRPARAPQFCSPSCRAVHFHNPQHPRT